MTSKQTLPRDIKLKYNIYMNTVADMTINDFITLMEYLIERS